jgi:voltage-gated potassium channel
MKRLIRRFRAHYHYLRRPLLRFLLLFLVATTVVLAGGHCFHEYYRQAPYDQVRMGYGKALYLTYCLIFMEHLYEYPDHWVLQLFYWLLPPLGLGVILDGIVRFSFYILKRDEQSQEWLSAMAKTYQNHVVLCGLGRVGLRILQQLLPLGEDVLVLEKNPDSESIPFARKHEIPVFIGSGREEGILEELSIGQAKSIIVATDDDLANLEMALDARKLNPDIRVVMRMFDQELALKIREAFDIQNAFSTSALAAPVFATSSSDRSIINSFYIDDKLLVVAEIGVAEKSKLIGRDVRTLRGKHNIYVISCKRDGESVFYPEGGQKLVAGDRITIQTEPATLKQVHKWNGGEAVA